MASIRWNEAPATAPPEAVPSQAPIGTGAGMAAAVAPHSVARYLLRVPGRRPLALVGVHLMRLRGPEANEGQPRFFIDLYQKLEGGFAVSIGIENGDREKPIGAFSGPSLDELAESCGAVDPTDFVWCQPSFRGVREEDISPAVRAEYLFAYVSDIRENFRATVARLQQKPDTENIVE